VAVLYFHESTKGRFWQDTHKSALTKDTVTHTNGSVTLSIHPMALQPKWGLGLYLLPPQCSIIRASFQLRQRKNLVVSCWTASSHLFLGFPTDLTPPHLALSTFLGICVPSILWTWPAHWSLFSLIHVTRSGSPYKSNHTLSLNHCCVTTYLPW
jgi:hypothetical protein